MATKKTSITVADKTKAISEVKKRIGLVEVAFLSKSGMGGTTGVRILADALRRENKYSSVEVFTHGQRGGPTIHYLRYCDSPLVPKGPFIRTDHVVMFDETRMGAVDPQIEDVLLNFPTGLLIVNTSRPPEEWHYDYKFEGEAIAVDIADIAESVTEYRPAPPALPLVGVYAGATGAVKLNSLLAAIEYFFSHHGLHTAVKDKVVPPNLKAARDTYEMGKSAKRVPLRGLGTRVKGYTYEDMAAVERALRVHGHHGLPPVSLPSYQSGKNSYIFRDSVPIWIESKCERCEICWSWLFCPEHNYKIIRPGRGGKPFDVFIDYSYCKGCFVCETECTCGAVQMRPQEEVGGALVSIA